MRLNYECIRDILIYIADNQHYTFLNGNIGSLNPMPYQEILQSGNIAGTYGLDDFWYSLEALDKHGYISVRHTNIRNSTAHFSYEVLDITPAGHEFLGTFKEQTIFQAAIARLEGTIGGYTLSALMASGKYLTNLAITEPESFIRCMSVLGI